VQYVVWKRIFTGKWGNRKIRNGGLNGRKGRRQEEEAAIITKQEEHVNLMEGEEENSHL